MVTGIEQYFLERAGYFVRRNVLTAETRTAARSAAERIAARTEDMPERRQMLLHPKAREPIFVDLLTDSALLLPVESAVGPVVRYQAAALVTEQTVIMWQRGTGPAWDAAETVQIARLARCQENLTCRVALCDEAALLLLPGTHTAPPDAAQRVALSEGNAMVEGAVRVRLEAGDAVFYNAALVQRDAPETDAPRRTLAFAYIGMQQPDQPPVAEPWLADGAFLATLDPLARGLIERALDPVAYGR